MTPSFRLAATSRAREPGGLTLEDDTRTLSRARLEEEMRMKFFLSVKYERVARLFFWVLWKSTCAPRSLQPCWDCGFAPDVHSAVRAARAVETVGSNRVTLLHPNSAHAVCRHCFPSLADKRCRDLDEDEPFYVLRLAQIRRDAARVRRKYESVNSGAREPSARGWQTPPPFRREASPPPWSAVLAVSTPCTPADLKRAYFALVKKVHPDVGGTNAEFIRVTAAYQDGLRDLRAQAG